jgi:hypothetical protein
MKFRGKAVILGLVLCCALAGAGLAAEKLAWDGKEWKEFTHELKVAYIKGVLNMAAYETAAGGASRAVCISKAFTEELKVKTLGQVIKEVDAYYQKNPQKMDTPVIDVLLRQCTKLCPPEPAAEKKK